MGRKNAYCGLMNRIDGTYLYLVPEVDGGKKLRYEDVDEYMNHMHINYDKVEVNKLITMLTTRKEYKLLPEPMKLPEDEYLSVKIETNRLYATGKFYPPSQGGKVMTSDDIISRFNQCGVKFGIDDLAIKQFLSDRQYCGDILLAKAMPPVEGSDAKIIYNFNTELTKRPRANEDGSVDFHQLDNINHVMKGDLLATLIPADDGKPGMDVSGAPIKQQKVIHRTLRYGNKIVMDETGTKIFSEVNGHVSLVEEKVFVNDTLEIPSDVGPSTGDIVYDGNVSVKGSVVSGYSIQSKGDIVVEGVVECANLSAEGQIILKRGIQGGARGVLKAGSNVIAKFIESAEVVSGGFVQTEAIMHSRVSARSDVLVGGKKGFITGGEIHSGNSIVAKTAGNTMGTRTLLEVGVDPSVVEEFRRLEKDMPNMEIEISKIDQLLSAYAKKVKAGEKLDLRIVISVKESAKRMTELKTDLELKKEKYVELHNEMESNQNGFVKISDSIYPGCRIVISNVSCFIKSETQHSRFIREGADIKAMPM